MKTATGLTLMAIGAILAFAVNAHPRVLNLQVTGWVIILTGLAWIFVPRRGSGWMRRRVVIRRGQQGRVSTVEETRRPPYMLNPGPPPEGESAVADTGEPGGPAAGRSRAPESETVEEYFEE
jgi:hypothetical protein